MRTETAFRSLRRRLLGPLIATACGAAILVAIASYWLGTRWSRAEVQNRLDAIEATLADAMFPLNQTVLDSLAKLTQTQLVTRGESGWIQHATIAGITDQPDPGGASARDDQSRESIASQATVAIAGKLYSRYSFQTLRSGARTDGVFQVDVLFDRAQIQASRRRAALLPLATGLSTILALSTITLVISSRLVGRISSLQQRVETVAAGDFQSSVSDHVADEIGQLGGAVDQMATQLDQLWKQVNRQQSEKLLHQVAGGLAHQLRNSLTGARMAVELHGSQCEQADDEGLRVAIDQIELAENFVRRLLLVASGRQDQDRPATAMQCINDIRSSLSAIARHLRIDLDWQIDPAAADHTLRDGPTWIAAVTNLVHNAMQAGNRVRVELDRTADQRLRIRVADNGDGVPESVAAELFEPFVTSKPEGMGLGLSVVRRAAEYLGGEVHWERQENWTVFEMIVT